MKRVFAVLLAFCMIAGLSGPSGAGVMTGIEANTRAALRNVSGESASGESGKFDRAIGELYDNSMSATDEEVLASAQKMPSDFEAVESALGEGAVSLIETLKSYEAAKSRYMNFPRTSPVMKVRTIR